MGHEMLKQLIEDEAKRQDITMEELSIRWKLNGNQLYIIRHGRRPGFEVCKKIAIATHMSIGRILFMAGHVDEALAGIIPNTDLDVDRINNMLEMLCDDPKLHAYAKRSLMAQLEALMVARDSD